MIDDAILRPGRLMCIYEFGSLKGERLNNLITKLNIEKDIIRRLNLSDGVPIAKLFNSDSLDWCKVNEKRKIGFN
jgi:hypothetical protein